MACNSGGTKKKIIISSLAMGGVVVGSYFAFNSLHNPALAVAMPVLLVLAPCLVMCGAIGGSMWLAGKRRNKNTVSSSCGAHQESVIAGTEDKNKNLQVLKDQSNIKASQPTQEI